MCYNMQTWVECWADEGMFGATVSGIRGYLIRVKAGFSHTILAEILNVSHKPQPRVIMCFLDRSRLGENYGHVVVDMRDNLPELFRFEGFAPHGARCWNLNLVTLSGRGEFLEPRSSKKQRQRVDLYLAKLLWIGCWNIGC